jgi:hypothetical protein
MNKYKLYKALKGRKVYLTVDMDISVSNLDAIKIADTYFKAGKNNLKCETGRIIGKDLYLDDTEGEYPKRMGIANYDVWVITRK